MFFLSPALRCLIQFSIVFNPYDENDEYVCPESFDRVQNICLYMLNDGTDGIEGIDGIDNIQVEISKLKKEDTSDDIDYSDYGPYSRFRLVKQPRMDVSINENVMLYIL